MFDAHKYRFFNRLVLFNGDKNEIYICVTLNVYFTTIGCDSLLFALDG